MLERGVERVGEEAERGQREGAGPAGGVAHRQREDFLGELRRPACGRGVTIGGSVGTGWRIEGERAQGALHGGDGESGAGVEGTGALAGAAPTHQVPLPGEDDAGDELLRLGADPPVEFESALRRLPTSGLLHETGDLHRVTRPGLRPRTALLPLVRPGRNILRGGLPDFKRQRLVVGFLFVLADALEQIRAGPARGRRRAPTRRRCGRPICRPGGRPVGRPIRVDALGCLVGRRRALPEPFKQGPERPVLHRLEAR